MAVTEPSHESTSREQVTHRDGLHRNGERSHCSVRARDGNGPVPRPVEPNGIARGVTMHDDLTMDQVDDPALPDAIRRVKLCLVTAIVRQGRLAISTTSSALRGCSV